MTKLKFFITDEFSPALQKALMAYDIICMHASFIGLEATINAQLNYCFSYNMIMVTKSNVTVKTCKALQLPVMYVEGNCGTESIVKQVLTYICETEPMFR